MRLEIEVLPMVDMDVRSLLTRGLAVGAGLVAAVFLSGCEEEQPKVTERIRAIKTITVVEIASGQLRKYSGIVVAADSSALSFQVGGNVSKVNVKLGAKVNKGQVLAELDAKPYQLDVRAAEAELGKSRAQQAQAKQELDRQTTLYKKGWVAKAAYDRAVRSNESAVNQVDYAISKLNLAKRNLNLTKLTAPFDGVISERQVDPFVEVSAGQKLFQIEAKGALEVRMEIPETVISRIAVGMPVKVRFPTEKDAIGEGRITEVGSTASEANAFPVKATLLAAPEAIRSGMTAETSVVLASDQVDTAYLIPISAVAPSDDPEKRGSVFVYDEQAGTVTRRLIKTAGISENMVQVSEGVQAGDVIAVAGVSFLRDGQRVKLLQP
jgi:RND family efflux transporter MFP subunit